MSASGMSFEEISESVTGFDEIAVEKHMGFDLYTAGETKPIGLMRALVFVHKRHEGDTDVQAKEAALSMTLKEINNYFDTDDEAMPEEPVTEAGKGSSDSVTEPLNLQPSA